MYARNIQIWNYVTAFFRSPINTLNVKCIVKDKKPCLARPKVMVTAMKAWE